MGMFSWNCERCGHPLLCIEACEDDNKWMNDVVVLTSDGCVFKGQYDGYGRVLTASSEYDFCEGSPMCYHRDCYEIDGSPTEWRGESGRAKDQGWFFEDGVHNVPSPLGSDSSRS